MPIADIADLIRLLRRRGRAVSAARSSKNTHAPLSGYAVFCDLATFTYVKVQIWDLPANWRRISAVKSEQARWQFYDLSAPEDPAFGSIAAMIAAWTF